MVLVIRTGVKDGFFQPDDVKTWCDVLSLWCRYEGFGEVEGLSGIKWEKSSFHTFRTAENHMPDNCSPTGYVHAVGRMIFCRVSDGIHAGKDIMC